MFTVFIHTDQHNESQDCEGTEHGGGEGRGGRRCSASSDHCGAAHGLRAVRRPAQEASTLPWPASRSHTSVPDIVCRVVPWRGWGGWLWTSDDSTGRRGLLAPTIQLPGALRLRWRYLSAIQREGRPYDFDQRWTTWPLRVHDRHRSAVHHGE